MTRLLPAFAALAMSSALLSSVAATALPPAPPVIGAENPVFLGRMIVTATPL
ncbi:hypothetical protein [Novosphingobium guangzhouense]|uniref:hypothetical protein n=1 Tax=Novosphingobium guangzhouense TaxID=1850347 RepID=UPI001475E07C|nr:hypothetical protein [Novosphingobium guangzhouense]